jgi:hypothetical protein
MIKKDKTSKKVLNLNSKTEVSDCIPVDYGGSDLIPNIRKRKKFSLEE